MPKKATSSSRIVAPKEDGAKQGYYVYSDGSSNWGVGIFKNNEFPLLINADGEEAKKIHKSPVAEKLEWYKKRKAELKED